MREYYTLAMESLEAVAVAEEKKKELKESSEIANVSGNVVKSGEKCLTDDCQIRIKPEYGR